MAAGRCNIGKLDLCFVVKVDGCVRRLGNLVGYLQACMTELCEGIDSSSMASSDDSGGALWVHRVRSLRRVYQKRFVTKARMEGWQAIY